MIMSTAGLVTIVDDAVADARGLARALRPFLGAHPVPHGDSRARGLLLEFAGVDAFAGIARDIPPLGALAALTEAAPGTVTVLAVNATPPTAPDVFFLRPHVDRRWLGHGFGAAPPRSTVVMFLDFPAGGKGGELAVFPIGTFAGGTDVARTEARTTVRRHGGRWIAPQPGRACRMAGECPHAMLGYRAPPGSDHRLAVVVAVFPLSADDPPPCGIWRGRH